MKKLMDVFILLCLVSVPVLGQNMNPQTNFNAQVQLAAPNLWLNYNDATASFKDGVSGLTFGQGTYSGYFNGSNDELTTASTSLLSTAAVTQAAYVCVGSLSAAYAAIIDVNSAEQIMVKSNGKLAIYYSASGSVNYDGTGSQTLHSGNCYFVAATYDSVNGLKGYVNGVVDGTAAANGALVAGTGTTTIGWWGTAYAGARNWTGTIKNVSMYNVALTQTQIQGLQVGTSYAGLLAFWPINEGTGTAALDTGGNSLNATWSGTPAGSSGYYAGKSANPTLQQPGFDNTNPANYSAAFPYNGFTVAPNNTLGAIDWSSPWSMLLHIDRLNWNRTGTLVLASKGDSSSTSNSWWNLALNANSQPSNVRLCFTRNGATTSGGMGSVGNSLCSNLDAMTNGYNYDIVVTDNGAGTGAALDMYINGLDKSVIPEIATSTSYQYGFGAVNLTISGGTGYAASTAFTATGGGPNCTVSGTIPATSGVPTAGLLSSAYFNNYNAGCTSLPTITLTSPTGTGMVITPSFAGGSMNSTSAPLMVPGTMKGGAFNGIDQSDSTQAATNVDEFAVFPGVMSATNIQALYALTNFYQGVMPATPQHIPVIVNEITCADYDATTTIAVLVKLHQLGYVNLLGIGVESDNGIGAAYFRQVLDQAGMNHVPVAMASNSSTIPAGGSGWCAAASVTAYNASTSQSYTGYPTTASMYRQIFAAHPTTAITLLIPTTLFGIYDFMNSAADSISPLTGTQLWAQNVTNGGSMYLEGGPDCESSTLPVTTPCSYSVSGDNSLVYPTQAQYVLNHLAGLPVYLMGGSPAPNGPGALSTRTSKDPLYLASAFVGNDSRTAWDSLGTMMMLSGLFEGGVQIGYSGGTGYANATAFTSTGGGINCHVDGYMMASGGVPNGIKTSWGSNYALSTWLSYGHGCTSAPTIVLTAPTGTGVTLTAYPSNVCGTDTITQTSGVWADSFNSATCSNQYVAIPSWQAAPPSSGGSSPIYQWILNSLVNPVPVSQPKVQ